MLFYTYFNQISNIYYKRVQEFEDRIHYLSQRFESNAAKATADKSDPQQRAI
jgi:hypothetical protein